MSNPKINLIAGPIHSQKKALLVKQISVYCKNQNYKCALICLQEDVDTIKNNLNQNNLPILVINDLIAGIELCDEYNIIGIVNAHKYIHLLEYSLIMINMNKTIIITCLFSDEYQSPYIEVTRLLPFCNKIENLKGVCYNCLNDGSLTIKKNTNYNTICNKCYINLSINNASQSI